MGLIYHPWKKNSCSCTYVDQWHQKGLVVHGKIIFLHMKHTMKMLDFLFTDDNVYTIVQF